RLPRAAVPLPQRHVIRSLAEGHFLVLAFPPACSCSCDTKRVSLVNNLQYHINTAIVPIRIQLEYTMASMTTPVRFEPRPRSDSHSRTRSGADRNLPSRPTTPLRPPSRTSLRASQSTPTAGSTLGGNDFPLATLEPAFGELSDAMADLEANMMHLQLLNESISRFNENFAAFLYGMNMTAFCVDFPEAPISQSYQRHKDGNNPLDDSPFHDQRTPRANHDGNIEATFLTSDTSGFVENPPMSSKASSKFSSVPPSTAKSTRTTGAPARGGASGTSGRGTARGRGSGIARGTSSRGAAGSRGSGIARGVGRGRGTR
ncbi:DASH complex subunit DAM1, partial [Pseudocercospora fuligena]